MRPRRCLLLPMSDLTSYNCNANPRGWHLYLAKVRDHQKTYKPQFCYRTNLFVMLMNLQRLHFPLYLLCLCKNGLCPHLLQSEDDVSTILYCYRGPDPSFEQDDLPKAVIRETNNKDPLLP